MATAASGGAPPATARQLRRADTTAFNVEPPRQLRRARSARELSPRAAGSAAMMKQRTATAFGRKVAEKEQLQGDEARAARQVKKVREKLLDAFDVERDRLGGDDAAGANTARRAFRDARSTRELRRAIDYVEDRGVMSSLAMLQMTCAYMDSPGWLEAQIAEGGSDRESGPEGSERAAAMEARELKRVRSSLRSRRKQDKTMEMITQALGGVLRKHLGHVPLPEVWRRWRTKVQQLKSKRANDERLAKQTNAIMERRREQMEAWQSRASMVKSVDASPGPDQTDCASGEKQPNFGIGGGGSVDLSGEQERPSLAGFPSTELQLQLMQCRHTPAGPRRRALVSQLQLSARYELMRRWRRDMAEAADAAQSWLAENGMAVGLAGPAHPVSFKAAAPRVLSARHPPALLRAVAAHVDRPTAPKLQPPAANKIRSMDDAILAWRESTRGEEGEVTITLDRPLREIDEAVVKLAVAELSGNGGMPPRAGGGATSTSRHRQLQQKACLIKNLGMQFDDEYEELLDVVEGSAAAAATAAQPQLAPGLFLTHVQGSAIRWSTAVSGVGTSDRTSQINSLLRSALESGNPLTFGFTSQPLHVYRILHEGTVAQAAAAAADAAASAARPSPPASPTGRHSRPASAAAARRPSSARPVSATTRPLGATAGARPQRPASARPDYARGTLRGGEPQRAKSPEEEDQRCVAGKAMAVREHPSEGTASTGATHRRERPPAAPVGARANCTAAIAGGAKAMVRMRQRPGTAPPAAAGSARAAAAAAAAGGSARSRVQRVLGTVASEKAGGAAWSYTNFTASVPTAGPPGTVDTSSAREAVPIDDKLAQAVQYRMQREKDWDAGQVVHGTARRNTKPPIRPKSGARCRPGSAGGAGCLFDGTALLRDAEKKWQAPKQAGRRGSASGALYGWSRAGREEQDGQ